MGKIPDARLIALGTRPSDDTHWFARLLDGGADYSQCHMAGPDDPPFRARTWRKANPSLPAMPMLESAIRREAKRARHDTSSLAAFRALRLNQGVDDVLIDTLIDVESWLAAERREGDRRGRYILGVDLGSSAAMSAACAYWPETGALDAFAVFPERPSLRERGLGDAVGDVYIRMSERGELIQAGERVSDVPALFAESRHRWGDPHVVVCDRWREAELRQSLPMPAQVLTRGMGYMDGGEDVRDFRAAVLDGYVAAPESLLLRSALSNARVARDMAGNSKLAKAKDGHRDDAAAAAILAVGLGYRLRRQRPRSRRKVVQV